MTDSIELVQMAEQRRLKAIVFTDIEGYTALMQNDEDAAVKMVEKHRQTLEMLVPEFQGEVLQYYGDGSLSTFDSAIMAVRCSWKMQEIFVENHVPVRIGIHIGDVLYKGDQIYGDGVNISSRIQSQGVAGCVLLSGEVYQKVKNQKEFQLRDLGDFDLKNVTGPTRIYALANGSLRIPIQHQNQEARSDGRNVKPSRNVRYAMIILLLTILAFFMREILSKSNNKLVSVELPKTEKSIAVLPFTNLNEEDGEYFSDGIHESLIFNLSKIKALKVISRTSMTRYKEGQKSIPEIANELGVDAMIEASVLRVEDIVRITVQLIDGRTDYHIWSQQYDRNLENVLDLINEVTFDISSQVQVAMAPGAGFSDHPQLVNPVAHDLYLKGRYMFNQLTREGFEKSLDYYDQSISVDSTFAQAWAGKAGTYVLQGYFNHLNFNDVRQQATAAAKRAIRLDPNESAAQSALGWIHLMEWKWDEAREAFQKAIEINPNDVDALHGLGDYLTLMHRGEEGLILVQKNYELDPFSPIYSLPHIGHLIMMGRNEEALLKIKEYQILHPQTSLEGFVSSIYWNLGRFDESIISYRKVIANDSARMEALDEGMAESGAFGAILSVAELLESRIKGESSTSLQIAGLYARLGNADKTMEWLDAAYEARHARLFYVKLLPDYNPVRSDPRFQDLLTKMNLPRDPL